MNYLIIYIFILIINQSLIYSYLKIPFKTLEAKQESIHSFSNNYIYFNLSLGYPIQTSKNIVVKQERYHFYIRNESFSYEKSKTNKIISNENFEINNCICRKGLFLMDNIYMTENKYDNVSFILCTKSFSDEYSFFDGEMGFNIGYEQKYDSNYILPKPVKIIKKYEYGRINNIIIKDCNNKHNNFTEEEICELSNIVQMFEDGDQNNKNNKENENKKDSTKINNNISLNENNNNLETEFKQEKAQKEKMDVISENYELNEQEKSESESDKNISIEDKCFYLIKWNTSEYSLELDSFMETFPNFEQILSTETFYNTTFNVKNSNNLEKISEIITKQKAIVSMSGAALNYIIKKLKDSKEKYIDNERKCLKKDLEILIRKFGRIFYRMTPRNKAELIEFYKKDNKSIIIMCGDGSNDIPAILESDIGIAINQKSDMQVLSHFYMNNSSIQCVEIIVKTGRACFESNEMIFKSMILYGIIQTFSLIILKRIKIYKFTPKQKLYSDILCVFIPIIFASQTAPSLILAKEAIGTSLLNKKFIFSVSAQIFIQITTLILFSW